MPRTQAFFFAACLVLASLLLAAGASAQDASPRVLVAEFESDINPVTQDYLVEAIERGEREGYDAVVLQIDTPGGLDSSMREIIKAQLASEVPVVVYVAPPGARAASAGLFITMAADVAAMAPQTNIGSATPVAVGGEGIPEDLRRKVVNDAAAYIRELAEEHDRNGDWAEDAVRRAVNVGAQEALELGVIDVIADDLPSLLEEIDGMTTVPKGLVLNTAGASIDTIEMSLWKQILDTLIDPNIIVLLMSLGVLGITIEILNPGLIFPGTIGVVSLIIGLFGLQVLPISWAGVLLLLLAVVFFAAEAFVASAGVLSLAGAIAFVAGALMLFDPAGDVYSVSIPVAVAIAASLALFTAFALTRALQARRAPTKTGQEELLGETGLVRRELDPAGLVFLHGELWRAHTSGRHIPAGERVRVVSIGDDLVLEVAPAEHPVAATV
ncbi:MAG TPA: nodulation protein NfeD [Gaiellaceae bacterium]|nr:nodulation protein NfeD [Gaiellaceae bacterium]